MVFKNARLLLNSAGKYDFLFAQLERLENLELLLVLELKDVVVKQIDKLSLPLSAKDGSGIPLDS